MDKIINNLQEPLTLFKSQVEVKLAVMEFLVYIGFPLFKPIRMNSRCESWKARGRANSLGSNHGKPVIFVLVFSLLGR